jgi:hypothetical protein
MSGIVTVRAIIPMTASPEIIARIRESARRQAALQTWPKIADGEPHTVRVTEENELRSPMDYAFYMEIEVSID